MKFKKSTRTVKAFGREQEVKGYICNEIFICKGDSLTSKHPWYSFKSNGESIDLSGRSTREDAIYYAEILLELN